VRLRNRVDRMESLLPAPPETSTDGRRRRGWRAVARRFTGLARQAMPLMDEPAGRQVEEAVQAYVAGTLGPLGR
jgi:hypothetical protein